MALLRQKFGFRLDSDVKTAKITQLQTRLYSLTTARLETLGSEQKYFKKFRKATYCSITAAVRGTLGIFKNIFGQTLRLLRKVRNLLK